MMTPPLIDLGQNKRLESLPDSVLFVCNLNKVRSPMAASLLRQIWGNRIFIDCCGVRVEDGKDPFVIAVMEEIGIDLNTHQPKSFEGLEDSDFDLIISLTPEAHHHALNFNHSQLSQVLYWPTLDPSIEEGGREQRLFHYRGVRDSLNYHIETHFGRPLGFGG